MPDDQLEQAISQAREAHERLNRTIESLTDAAARRPSRLPGWSIGHLLTHVARSADSHARTLNAALGGESVMQYAGGDEERAAAIEAGAGRSASELVEDVATSSWRLEEVWAAMTPAAWDGHGNSSRGYEFSCRTVPFFRLREVEVHHVDLGLGYEAADWPDAYVSEELARALALVPERAGPGDQRALLAWLLGRASEPEIELAPWQERREHYYR